MLPDIKKDDICIIVHLYYTDMLEQIIGYLNNIPYQYNLTVTVVKIDYCDFLKDKIINFHPTAKIILVDGDGMDIKPFLIAYKQVPANCKYILKIHTKKSIAVGANMGLNWFKEMMEHTLENPDLVESIITSFIETNVGMIGGNLIYDQSQSIYPNHDNIEELKSILGISQDKFKWIAGSIFWCKRDALNRLDEKIDRLIELMSVEYKTDGTFPHAMERVFGALVYANNNIVRKKPFNIKSSKSRVLFINHDQNSDSGLFKEIIEGVIKGGKYDCYVLNIKQSSDKWRINNYSNLSEFEGDLDEDKMISASKAISPDLVFFNSLNTCKYEKYFTCKKVVLLQEYKTIISHINFNTLKSFDKVIVVNEGAKQLLQNYDIQSTCIQYYSSISAPYTNWIISVGNACYNNGIDRFMFVADNMPNEKFLWIGEYSDISDGYIKIDDYDYEIPAKPKSVNSKIKIPKNVIFLGNQSQEQINLKWMPKCKLLMSLSRNEAFSLPILHAKINKSKVLVIKDSGDSYMICDENDFILDSFNESNTVELIKSIPESTSINTRIIDLINRNIILFSNEIDNLFL